MMWKAFGFEDLKFYLSTRPEKAVGTDELWTKAEDSLKKALEAENLEYEIDEGGAHHVYYDQNTPHQSGLVAFELGPFAL